jgi:hypothetical protein
MAYLLVLSLPNGQVFKARARDVLVVDQDACKELRCKDVTWDGASFVDYCAGKSVEGNDTTEDNDGGVCG